VAQKKNSPNNKTANATLQFIHPFTAIWQITNSNNTTLISNKIGR